MPTARKTVPTTAIDYARELNKEQFAVVRHAGGPAVVLAGAGSGKTRTVVFRVAKLIEDGVAPETILLLTFTNKAANEMMTRIGELLGGSHPEVRRLWGGTFHSVANRLLRSYAQSIGFTPSFTILDEEDSRLLVKATMKDVGVDPKEKRFPSPAVVQHVLSYSRNALMSIDDAIAKLHPKFEPLADKFGEIAEAYDRKKRGANAMDFDDLLVRLHALLAGNESVRDRLRRQFRHVLVDEFQDTNALQGALVRQLVGEGTELVVVGDDAQSIYSFRAAEIRNILDFPKWFPGAAMYKLETNYRSVPEVLDLANDVISRNAAQFPKELRSVKDRHVKPMVAPAPSAYKEAEFVADEIEKLLHEGVDVRDIAVLFRATHHSQALEFELTKRSVLYDYRGGVRFFERAHVKDVLAFLRLWANVADEAAWLRVLGLQVGIGDVTAARVFAMLRAAGSLAQAVAVPVEERVGEKVARGWLDLRNILENMLATGGKPAEVIRAVIDSAYVEYLESEYPDYADRLADLEQLAVFAENYEDAPTFLAEITLDDAAYRGVARRAGEPRVVLSTIHQAKGLEWDSVFIIHLTGSGFPNRRAIMEEGGLEEERRLFYVAVTRAKRNLYLCYPSTTGRDAFTFEQPSCFIEECDPSCLDLSKSGDAFSGDSSHVAFHEDDTVSYDDDGSQPDLDDPFADIKGRMKKVNKEWKKKSFLRDV